MTTLTQQKQHMQKLAEKHNPKPGATTLKYFAQSLSEINPLKIQPILIRVENETHNKIFQHACSFWSIPISNGFGRRLRYIVFDKGNYKVIGIFGLCDPVIGLSVRDSYIGWTLETKLERLYSVFTAYILGAVPPYNQLLGAKLVALMATSYEVQQALYNLYKSTAIERNKPFYPALIDTLGAFGKSVIYNRLRGWKFIGYTKGITHYHLTLDEEFYNQVIQTLKQNGKEEVLKSYGIDNGPNYKFRVLKTALPLMNLDTDILNYGMKRGYYICPLIQNWQDFLTGKTDTPIGHAYPLQEQIQHWKTRWLVKRL